MAGLGERTVFLAGSDAEGEAVNYSLLSSSGTPWKERLVFQSLLANLSSRHSR